MSRRDARKAWFGEGWATFPQLVHPIGLPEAVLELLRAEQHSEAWIQLDRIAADLGWSGTHLLWRASNAEVAEATMELAFEYSSGYQPQYALRLATFAVKEATHPQTLAMAQQMRLAWLWEWTGNIDALQGLIDSMAPLTPSARLIVARYLSEQERYDEAINILQELTSQGFVDATLQLGNALDEVGRIDEALDAYRLGGIGARGDRRCAFNAGKMLARAGRAGEADYWFRFAASQGEPRALYRLRSEARSRKRERQRLG